MRSNPRETWAQANLGKRCGWHGVRKVLQNGETFVYLINSYGILVMYTRHYTKLFKNINLFTPWRG